MSKEKETVDDSPDKNDTGTSVPEPRPEPAPHAIRGDDLWKAFESQGAFIPDDLKKILKVTKYDNMLAIANFMPEDEDKIVGFMRKTLHTIIPSEMREEYYDIFQYNPEKFVLVPGQELCLKAIVRIAKSILHKPASEPQENESKDSSAIIIEHQRKLEEGIQKFLGTLCPGQNFTVSSTVQPDGHGSFSATVDCPMENCTKKSKISRNNTRWNTSNFYAHVRTHIKPVDGPKNHQGKYFTKENSSGSGEGSQKADRKRRKVTTPSDESEAEDDLSNCMCNNCYLLYPHAHAL